jgi:P-type E1-E2 ATPase
MILEADIGIGLFGNEGMRAVDNSDFAIAEFRFLWFLLFKHGRLNYMRMADFTGYFFYKNFVYTFL